MGLPFSEKLQGIDDFPPTDETGEVDLSLLWQMQAMTPAQRLSFHDAMRQSALEIRRAGRKHYGITGYDDIDPESVAPTNGSAD